MNIKEARNKEKITQKELAEKTKINIRLIQKYENEESKIENITLKNAIKIAKILNITTEELIN